VTTPTSAYQRFKAFASKADKLSDEFLIVGGIFQLAIMTVDSNFAILNVIFFLIAMLVGILYYSVSF